MFAEVLDPQQEFMFPIVLPNLSKKFYCSRQSLLGLLGRASSERISEWACVIHGNTFPVPGETGADSTILTWFVLSLYYEMNRVRFFCVEILTSEKVMGSLTIAWGRWSQLHLSEISGHQEFFISEVEGVAHQGVHLCMHIARVCTALGQKGLLVTAAVPGRLPWASSRRKHH